MTLEELTKTFRAGLFGHLGENPYATVTEGDLAGVKAVVMALRDEALPDPYIAPQWEVGDVISVFDKILASDGVVKAAGGSTSNDEQPVQPGPTSPAADLLRKYGVTLTLQPAELHDPTLPAAEFCEWTTDSKNLWFAWCDVQMGHRSYSVAPTNCPSCRKPIRFVEAAR